MSDVTLVERVARAMWASYPPNELEMIATRAAIRAVLEYYSDPNNASNVMRAACFIYAAGNDWSDAGCIAVAMKAELSQLDPTTPEGK